VSVYEHEYIIISQFSLFLDVIATQQSEQLSPWAVYNGKRRRLQTNQMD